MMFYNVPLKNTTIFSNMVIKLTFFKKKTCHSSLKIVYLLLLYIYII
jgi:hypothetical protein